MATPVLVITLTALASAACGFLSIPMILRFCERRGLYDLPGNRKIHRNATPRLGGLSFFPSMLVSLLVALSYVNAEGDVIVVSRWSVYFMLAVSLIFFMGIIDDVFGLLPRWKFAVQVVAACALPVSGLYVDSLHGLFGIHGIPFAASVPLTIVLVVFICNSINLVDGIDGLAASLSLVALAGFLLYFASCGHLAYSLLMAGFIGVLLSFLFFNLFGDERRHTKIFMGDSGSLVLGFVLAFLCVKCSMRTSPTMHVDARSFVMAYTLVLLPMMDAARVFVVRLYHGVSPFKADKNHIHHKLMRMGFTQRQTLLAILFLSLGYIALNYFLLPVCGITALLLLDLVSYGLLNVAVNRRIAYDEKQ